jgi:hypothetical protein
MVQDWPELTNLLTGRHREAGPARFPRVKATLWARRARP